MGKGKVYLVGAGPGDPGLLTNRGTEVLAAADAVLYDALVHPAILEHARADADLRFVGKRYRQPSISQEAINEMLVELAGQGSIVVRLKGGDPMLFARGAEEAEVLSRARIPFEIVPGVPSVLAAAAYAGIPLTHREHASTVMLMTGTEWDGKPKGSRDWSKIAGAADTICVVMGMKELGGIARNLMEHGEKPDTPVAVVQWASWPLQRVITGTLETIAKQVTEAGVTNPAVVIIGQVVNRREPLRWHDRRPLFGKRIAILRPAAQATATARAIRRRGAEPVVVPLIEVHPPPDVAAFENALRSLHEYDVVAFSSANGVNIAFAQLGRRNLDARAFGKAKVAAIGSATAQALRDLGLRPDIVASEYRGESLAEAILDDSRKRGRASPRVLVLRALEAREALPSMLRAAGAEVEVVAAYRTQPVTSAALASFSDDLDAGRIDAVLVTSNSIVTHLVSALGSNAAPRLARTVVASIGPVTTESATRAGLRVAVTASPFTVDALLDALEQHFGEVL